MAELILKSVSLWFSGRPTYTSFSNRKSKALKKQRKDVIVDIDLHLKSGDRYALIGRNGAGKTSLLRVMAGVYPPNQGEVNVQGEIFTFFGAGIGLNLELSGYENIILRGLYLGYKQKQIEKDYLPIISEAVDLGDDLFRPVKFYSAGMRARLAFCLHMFASASIFLIDEGLGAGDAKFINKAREIASDLLAQSEIVVFASHSVPLMKKFCDKAIYLEGGRVKHMGEIEDVLAVYEADA